MNRTEPTLNLWPHSVPHPHDATLEEKFFERDGIVIYQDTQNPRIELRIVESKVPAPMVLVCPGGGYNILAWDLEGTEIADWLNSIGFSAAILNYRTSQNREGALQDAQRAMGILREKAVALNIDPARIGVLGFSAGGHLAAHLCSKWNQRNYPTVDAADEQSCRPDFTVLVYPAYIGDKNLDTSEEISISKETPPAFIVQTQDDTTPVTNALAYYQALRKHDIPSELHLFPTGGHGYGLRPSDHAVSRWPSLAADWLTLNFK